MTTKTINPVYLKIIKWLSIIVVFSFAAMILVTASYIHYLQSQGRDYLIKGKLNVEKERPVMKTSKYTKYDILISNGLGLKGEAFSRVPNTIEGKIPTVIVLGGLQTGRKALDLIDDDQDVFLLSLSYPFEKPKIKDGLKKQLLTGNAINRAIYQTDTFIRLLIDYILGKSFIDPSRIIVVGASFGVPFSVRAVGENKELKALALLYGFSDGYCVYKNIFKFKNPLVRRLLAYLAAITIVGFEPIDNINKISPRPVLFINGKDDEMMPRECVDGIHRAAKEPKDIIWLEGLHMHPTNLPLIKKLTAMVIEWMKGNGYL
jgi:fermentation-respiration switch protein FrsA (DUF1100 family)